MSVHKKFVAPDGRIYCHCNIAGTVQYKTAVLTDDWNKVTCNRCLRIKNRKAIR